MASQGVDTVTTALATELWAASGQNALESSRILMISGKSDEEKFNDAAAQAYRAWAKTSVPSDISALVEDEKMRSLSPQSLHCTTLYLAFSYYLNRSRGAMAYCGAVGD
ncbi:hypothetical protein HYPSUDRAFT_208723 [Hypholoma sublateritium FD-334 SS-4]|uniref:Uncharacterized protein n=1 Tax=Hypholoma sublateritium (strain FD-334 SS-4) TaxID=945553 RepID=A0A0D2NCT8_HYPSF|nr:hypothetical protein HYPSUDRAFT_208723 [Hypholoma sublateritium FD-334 SS-4]